jgi:hypothetical protein
VLLIPFHPSPQICRAWSEVPKIAQKRCTGTVGKGSSMMLNHDRSWSIILNHHKPTSSWLSLPDQLVHIALYCIAPGAPQRKKRPSRTAIWFEDDVSMTGSPGTPVIWLSLNMICQNLDHRCITIYHNCFFHPNVS